MKTHSLINLSKDIAVLDDVKIADTFFTRLKGLMGKKKLLENEGLLIKPCNSIHTVGMKFPIDVVFIDQNNIVIHIIENMGKRKFSPIIKGSKYVIEANGNSLRDKLSIGDKVKLIK